MCIKFSELRNDTIVPFIGYCIDQNANIPTYSIIIQFMQNYSLNDLFQDCGGGIPHENWDFTRQIIFLYGIAYGIDYLHQNKIVHGNLNFCNILVSGNLLPKVSDFLISSFFPLKIENISDDKLIFMAPEFIESLQPTYKSDIYSFGICAIMIMMNNTNILGDDKPTGQELIDLIKSGVLLTLQPSIPSYMHDLLLRLISKDPKERPTVGKFLDELMAMIPDFTKDPTFNQQVLNDYINLITSAEDKMDEAAKKAKRDADSGDPEAMWRFARLRSKGIGCNKNETEAWYYYQKAAENNYKPAQIFIKASKKKNAAILAATDPKESKNPDASKYAKLKEKLRNRKGNKKVVSEEKNIVISTPLTDLKNEDLDPFDQDVILAEDPFFEERSTDMKMIIKQVKDKLLEPDGDFSKNIQQIIDDANFILTPESKERLLKIIAYIKYGIPVLLEGPTGTSKTLSVEMASKILDALKEENQEDFQEQEGNQNTAQDSDPNIDPSPKLKKIVESENLIRFNLSSETKTKDLIGRYVGNVNSWAGISQENGSFVKAFVEGKILLLDEINLASPSVLQCIEEALDSRWLSVEIPGKPLEPIKMNKNFRLVATQNPNKGLFAHKRQDLGLKFYSRFQVITFPAFSKDELLEIAKGLGRKFKYSDLSVIDALVNFHSEWTSKEEIQDDPQCFTIREIAATVHAFSEGKNVREAIMTIYGARYQKQMKNELIKTLNKYPELSIDEKPFEIPEDFDNCYINEALKETVKSAIFSLESGRNIIIAGKEGSGKTQVALWLSNHYNNAMEPKDKARLKTKSIISKFTKDKDEDKDKDRDEHFYCICTEDTKVADLIGHQSPNSKAEAGDTIIVWIPGFLTKAIKGGRCCVLESIDEAPATVTERLNGLLDQKYDGKERFFDIPENPNTNENRILIRDTFRILATCDVDKIGMISPAFLNRFDVIVLEDQITPSSNELDIDNFLSQLFKKFSYQAVERKKREEILKLIKQKREKKKKKPEIKKPVIKGMPVKIIEEIDESDDDDDDDDKIPEIKDSEIPEIIFNVSPECSKLAAVEIKENFKIWKNLSKMSRVCKAIATFMLEFKNDPILIGVKPQSIVYYALNLMSGDKIYDLKEVDAKIEKAFLNKLKENKTDSTDQEFYFDKSPLLCTFMSKLMAYSMIQQPVCVSGPTGVGKTSAARKFARMRYSYDDKKSGKFQMHSFHAGTKTSHFYGTSTLRNGKLDFIEGTLTTALENGDVFIADEFNLSPQAVMKSLAPALEQTIESDIFIPGLDNSISISPDFFFIACQNELGTLGRNAIPETISPRFVYIDYPTPSKEDLQNICVQISKGGETEDTKDLIPDQVSRKLAEYMTELNKLTGGYITPWSLRDIYKIFNRVRYQNNPIYSDNYIGVDIYHNIYFYTMSSVPENDQTSAMKQIRELFKLFGDSKFVEKYEKAFLEPPKIEKHDIDGETKKLQLRFLMKGPDFGVNIDFLLDNMTMSSDDIDEYNDDELSKLQSLWNTAFQICLSDKKEPILLMGNSGYKTFLSKLFNNNADIISLNQETTVAQLLGSSAFFLSSEAKHFYLKNLCNICILNQNEKVRILHELQDKWQNGILTNDDISTYVSRGKMSSLSFEYAIDHLAYLLLRNSEDDKCILSNTTLEFRPGLFLNAILQKKSLILKDLSNLPTIVLERFNELFSGKQNITLTEDIHDTFTPHDKKELTGFAENFRVFGTCPANTPSKLSEAVLSRFTVIASHDYTDTEKNIVLKTLCMINDFDFDLKFIDLFQTIKNSFKANSKLRPYSFQQMIKTIQLTSMINKESKKNSPEFNFGLSIFRVVGGLLSKKKRTALYEIIKKDVDPNFPSYFVEYEKELKEQKPNLVCPKSGTKGILSTYTNLLVPSSSAHSYNDSKKKGIAYTPLFCDILDVLHLGMSVRNPVILEGPPGQGKHTAIEYIANMMNVEVIYITISQSTKVDDLLGKLKIDRREDGIHVQMVKSRLAETISLSSDIVGMPIIVIENINNATPAVLNVLFSIFNIEIKSILLPSGETMQKGKFYLFGIFNTQQTATTRDKLPSSLINSVIYYVVKNPTFEEVKDVICVEFEEKGLNKAEISRFTEKFSKAINFLIEQSLPRIFTMNDISKYILFRNATTEVFTAPTTIMQMIFAYRFFQEDTINKIKENLKLNVGQQAMPSFRYDASKKYLLIHATDENKYLRVPLVPHADTDPYTEKKLSKVNSLTLTQKYCMIFMACAVLSKRACVIQGGTASGKSFIIRLFAELVGAKLNVFQMNSDSTIAMLAGQSLLSEKLSPADIEKFQSFYDIIVQEPKIQAQLDELGIYRNNPDDWTPTKFGEMVKKIDVIASNSKVESKEEIIQAIKDIRELMSPVHRFENKESKFVEAMREGEWVLIDGIESAPPEIAEKIASLCGENPELNLFECGPEFVYTRKNGIHHDFQLFITFNPFASKDNQAIDQSFLVKSVSFTLPEVDSQSERTAQILYGSMINQSYNSSLAEQVASRLAAMHNVAKEESKNRVDSFSGNIQFTGRTLKFMIEVLKYHQKYHLGEAVDVSSPIYFSIKYFYLNSVNDPSYFETFKKLLLSKFEENQSEIMSKLKENDMTVLQRNKNVLKRLRDIQIYLLRNGDHKYNFSNLMKDCEKIQASDISFIIKHINDTLKIIDDKYFGGNKVLYETFGTLKIVNSLLNGISEQFNKNFNVEKSFLQINEPEFSSEKELDHPVSKFNIISSLSKKKLISQKCSLLLNSLPEDSKSDHYHIALRLIRNFVEIKDKKSAFYSLIAFAIKCPMTIEFMRKIFPYHRFIGSDDEGVCLLFPVILSCIQQKVKFVVNFENDTYIGNDVKDIYKFKTEIYITIPTNFDASPETYITFGTQTMKFENKIDIDNLTNENRYKLGTYEYHYIMTRILEQLRINDPNIKTQNILNPKFITYLIAEFQSKIKNDPNPRYDRIVHISDFFSEEEIDSNTVQQQISTSQNSNPLAEDEEKRTKMVAYAWNIVTTLDHKKIESIETVVNPLESHVLHAIRKLYKKVTKKSCDVLEKFTEWVGTFDDNLPILMRYLANIDIQDDTNKLSEQSLLDEVNKEKHFFESSKFPIKEFHVEIFVKSLNDVESRIMKSTTSETQEKIHIKKEVDQIKYYLENSKDFFDNDHLRQALLDEINSKYEFITSSDLAIIQKRVRQLRDSIAKNSAKETDNKIIWPSLNISSGSRINDLNWQKLRILLGYSNTYNNLKELKNEKKAMKYLPKLKAFEITRSDDTKSNLLGASIDSLLDHYLKSEKCPNDLLSNAFHDLNATYLFQLAQFKIDYFYKYFLIIEEMNKYMNRTALLDDNEVFNTWQLSLTISENFEFVLPNINPNDMIYLLISKKVTNGKEEFLPGPFLKICSPELSTLVNFAPIFKKNYSTFEEAVADICQKAIYFYIGIKPDKTKTTTVLLNDLREYLKTRSMDLGIKTLFETLRRMIKFVSFQSEIKEEHRRFKFDDLDFLNYKALNLNEWYKENVDKYPSFVIWVLQNTPLFLKIIDTFRNSKDHIFKHKNHLPFWIHCLRVFSSKNCIEFIPKTVNKNISKEMNKIVSDEIRSKFTLLETGMISTLGTDWFNLLVPSVPSCFSQNFIHMMYNFLQSLSRDDKPTIHKEVITQLGLAAKRVIESVFNQQINQWYTNKIPENDDKSLGYFIKAPAGYISHRINEFLSDKCQAFNKSEAIKNFAEFIINNQELLAKSVVDVSDAFNNDKNKFKSHVQRNQEKVFSSVVKEKEKEYRLHMENYNSCLLSFQMNYRSSKRALIQRLSDLRDKLREIKLNFTDNTMFPGVFFSLIERQNVKALVTAYLKEKNARELSQYVLYVSSSTHQYQDQKFIDNLKKICELTNNIQSLFFSNTLHYWDFNKRNNADKYIDELSTRVLAVANAQSTNIPSEHPYESKLSDKALDDIKVLYSQFRDLIEAVKKQMVELPQPEQYVGIEATAIFQDAYLLKWPLVKEEPNRYDASKFVIRNTSSLQLPVITMNKNELKCSVKRIKHVVGPLIPSLYSKCVELNIVNLINEPLKCTLKMDRSCMDYFNCNHEIGPRNPIQISAKIPLNKKDVNEVVDCNGNLIIETKSKTKNAKILNVDLRIIFKIIPLKIKLYCKNYNLSLVSNKLRVCSNEFYSGQSVKIHLDYFYSSTISPFNNYLLESENDNEADEPEISINTSKKYLKFEMNTTESKKLHCTLKIAMSQTLYANILFECMLVPFCFFLEVYDPRKKAFVSNSIELFWAPKIQHKLTFRLMSPCTPKKAFAKIFFDLPKEMIIRKIIGLSGDEKNVSNDKNPYSTIRSYSCVQEISKNIAFSIVYEFNEHGFPPPDDKYEIRAAFAMKKKAFEKEIDIKKENRIKLSFLHFPVISSNKSTKPTTFYNTEGMNDIPIYIFNQFFNLFDEYYKGMNLDKYVSSNKSLCYVTPFQTVIDIIDQTKIEYREDQEDVKIISDAEINPLYLKLDTNGNILEKSNSILADKDGKIEMEDLIDLPTDDIPQEDKFTSLVGCLWGNSMGLNRMASMITTTSSMNKRIHFVTYTIIGEIEKSNWFPAFSNYPHHHKEIAVIPDNIELARARLIEALKFLLPRNKITSIELGEALSKPKIDTDELLTVISSDEKAINHQNFAILMLILMDKDNIRKVGDFVNALPKGLKARANKIRNHIPDKSVDDNLLIIYSYNMIYYLEKIFKTRYKEIVERKNSLNIDADSRMLSQYYCKAYGAFFDVPKSVLFDTPNPKSPISEAIASHKKSKESNKISPLQHKKYQYECFILMEKNDPVPAKITDSCPEAIWRIQNNPEMENNNDDEEDDSKINELPEIIVPQKNTVESLNNFFLTCSQGANVLPIFLSKKKNSKKKALDYFLILFKLYKQYNNGRKKNYSINSEAINLFNSSFCSCVNRLKSGSVDFSFLPPTDQKIINSIQDDGSNSEIIKIPLQDKVYLPRNIPWKTKIDYTKDMIFDATTRVEMINAAVADDVELTKTTFFDNGEIEDVKDEGEDDEQTVDDQQTEENVDDLVDISKIDVKGDDEADLSDNDFELPNPDDVNIDKNRVRLIQDIGKGKSKNLTKGKAIDEILSELTEKDGIDRVLSRIHSSSPKDVFQFKAVSIETIHNYASYLKHDHEDLHIKEFIPKASYLISVLVRSAAENLETEIKSGAIPFNYLSINLLFDCSSYISKVNKMFNMLLLTSFSFALYFLGIKYAISIVSDSKFKYILKTFDQPHSLEALQRVLDCCLIARYRTNYAETFYQFIEDMKTNESKENKDKDEKDEKEDEKEDEIAEDFKPQRALFLFSDGLDENLISINAWKKSVLKEAANSFGIIVTIPKEIQNQDKREMEGVWSKFSKETGDANSTMRLVTIKPDLNNPETIFNVCNCFKDVLTRSISVQNCTLPKQYKGPLFDYVMPNLMSEEFNLINLNTSKDIKKSIYVNIEKNDSSNRDTNKLQLDKVNITQFRGKTGKIISCNVDAKYHDNFQKYIHQTLNRLKNIFRSQLETIFKPNKASQTVLSSTGTDFDITALVLNLINPVPDPLIYLEEKGGLVRNYGVTVVIDASLSCFNFVTTVNSLKTVICLLCALSSVELPCVDVLLSTKESPIVLCSDVPSVYALSEKSAIWPALFSHFSQDVSPNCDLEAAIHAAYDLHRMRGTERTSLLFVLTDGLYMAARKQKIKNQVSLAVRCGINVIGIGIGIYPIGIKDLFSQSIVVLNPEKIIIAISCLFGDENPDELKVIKPLFPPLSKLKELCSVLNQFEEYEKHPMFKELKEKLFKTPCAMDAYSDYYNEEKFAGTDYNEVVDNPTGKNTEMYVANCFKGQKILILMLYNCDFNLQESLKVNKKYLSTGPDKDSDLCVKKAVEFFGIDIVVVEDYDAGMEELMKKDKDGNCIYYACWVINGWDYPIIPNGKNPQHIIAFNECLKLFWENGGAVVMLAEGEPFFVQTNLFLETITIPGRINDDGSREPSIKTKLRLHGNHEGKLTLLGTEDKNLPKPQEFYHTSNLYGTRSSLSHNLKKLYEGETISFVDYDPDQYKPFIPFMRDSKGGISALFYPADPSNHTGDIIIDCGYTKFFTNISSDGTFQYIQNIAAFTAQLENSLSFYHVKPEEYRPKGFNFDPTPLLNGNYPYKKVPKEEKVERLEQRIKNLQTLFAVDISGSIYKETYYHHILQKIFNKYKAGDLILLWDHQAKWSDYQTIKQIWENKEGYGGTYPLAFLRTIQETGKKAPHLIIVTDGEISQGDVQECVPFIHNNNIIFDIVDTYIVGTVGNNCSIGTIFQKEEVPSRIYLYHPHSDDPEVPQVLDVVSPEDIEVFNEIDQIDTRGKFFMNFNSIFQVVKSRMMGMEANPKIEEKLVNMKNRILADNAEFDPDFERKMNVLIDFSKGKYSNVFNNDILTAMANK
ncbi:hypothetical protein M9Y10_005420 [Tritrichomonas musculus]|uniref:Protein kinase domain-containing protein n=1 Tax=Tritrichomonas musculus TaxID=1915356 RepID=A0ABR2JLI5_9EUKA